MTYCCEPCALHPAPTDSPLAGADSNPSHKQLGGKLAGVPTKLKPGADPISYHEYLKVCVLTRSHPPVSLVRQQLPLATRLLHGQGARAAKRGVRRSAWRRYLVYRYRSSMTESLHHSKRLRHYRIDQPTWNAVTHTQALEPQARCILDPNRSPEGKSEVSAASAGLSSSSNNPVLAPGFDRVWRDSPRF